jgi:acyl carrier protein
MQEELLEFVRSVLLEDKGAGITADTLLFKEQLLDSMNILHLIGYVEKSLNRRLADEEIVMSNFQSVGAIADAFFEGEAPDSAGKARPLISDP